MSNRGALTVPTPIDQLVKQYQRPLIGVEIEETLRRILLCTCLHTIVRNLWFNSMVTDPLRGFSPTSRWHFAQNYVAIWSDYETTGSRSDQLHRN